MDLMKYLSNITTVPGTSGYEAPVAQAFESLFAPLCDEVTVDGTQSMVGVQLGEKHGPRVMLCAHIDEVGLITTGVDEDGSIVVACEGQEEIPSFPQALARAWVSGTGITEL